MYRRLLLLFASVYDLIIHQRGRRHRGAGQLRARVQGAGRAADHGRLHQRRRAFAPPVRRYEARATFLHACCGHAHAHARLPTPGMMITTHMAESSGLPSGERGLLRNPPVFWLACASPPPRAGSERPLFPNFTKTLEPLAMEETCHTCYASGQLKHGGTENRSWVDYRLS